MKIKWSLAFEKDAKKARLCVVLVLCIPVLAAVAGHLECVCVHSFLHARLQAG